MRRRLDSSAASLSLLQVRWAREGKTWRRHIDIKIIVRHMCEGHMARPSLNWYQNSWATDAPGSSAATSCHDEEEHVTAY